MGNEKWETRKWGNGTATHKFESVYKKTVECTVVQSS